MGAHFGYICPMDKALDGDIDIFESKLLAAISEKYAGEPEVVRRHLVYQNQLIEAMSVKTFRNYFLKQTKYAHARLPVLVKYLCDIKLELYFIETDIALSNRNVFLAPGGQEDLSRSPNNGHTVSFRAAILN